MGYWLFVGIGGIILGLSHFYLKYRVIFGGSLCEAITTGYAPFTSFSAYSQIVAGFDYNGEWLEKPTATLRLHTPKKRIGKIIYIYYNEKYPDNVVHKRKIAIFFDLFALAMFVVGVLIIADIIWWNTYWFYG